MQKFSDREIILNSIADEKNMCRIYGSLAAEATNANLRTDLSKISAESAELAGKMQEEMQKRSWTEETAASPEKKNAVFKAFSHSTPLD